ncbi:MAG TPA: hypothetical protein ENH82_06065 [bacterium]|nr:hypothetical protein [bacterium]
MKFPNRWGKYTLLLPPIVVWIVYTGIAGGKLRVFPNKFNYFKDLAVSFSQGRLDIDHPHRADLVYANDKYYLYWPPVPSLVYMPFTTLWGKRTPDTFIASCFGALNVYLLIVLLKLFSKRYELKLSQAGIVFLALFWGLGTVHFYMSMIGAVWYISQVMAQTFLMLSIICILTNTSPAILFLSGLFYSMAVYTRNHLIFAIFLIGVIYITKNKARDKKALIKNMMVFLTPFIIFSLANLAYNWARFGNIFDNGTSYHQMNPRYYEAFVKHGYLSFHNVPGNFVKETFMLPPFIKQFPFLKFDPEGFGFLWASPVFIFIFATAFYYKNGFVKHILRRPVDTVFSFDDIIVMSAAVVSGVFISLVVFMVMGTGWSQFASRYSLDYQLMMLLFGLFIIKIWNNSKIFKAVLIILLLISIYMNYHGMRFYLQAYEKYYYQKYGNIQNPSVPQSLSASALNYKAGSS